MVYAVMVALHQRSVSKQALQGLEGPKGWGH